MKILLFFTLLFLFLGFGLYPLNAQSYAKNGMVVSDSQIASEVGIAILQKGGNAIDASIATAFALQVTHPTAGNIGGGGFMVFMNVKGETTTLDFREKAPIQANENLFLDQNGTLPNGKNLYGNTSSVNHIGAKSIGVPGTVAGLYLAHQKYGSLAWKDLVQPAIDLAEDGFPLPYNMYQDAQYFKQNSPIPFLQHYFDDTDGEITEFGAQWKQPELAKTLIEIRDHGKDGFYQGKVAKEIVRYIQDNGGIMTQADLSQYEAIERKPIHGTFKGYDIYSMPPPSSGGVALVEMLNIVENAPLDSIEFGSAKYVHLIAESMRRAFADRAQYLGDPDFNPEMPIHDLISKTHARKRYQNIDWEKASISDSLAFGNAYEGDQTTHFSVIDKDYNAVSVTYTLEHAYGSGMGSEKLGFIFNNEMGDFNPKPGFTSSSGMIGTRPNLIQSEKRMLSSMSPTIIGKNGRVYLIIGSPGGRTIINTVFQTIFNVLQYEMPVDQAIESMKIHHQWLPNTLYYEAPLLSPDTRDLLESMGHHMQGVGNLGDLMGIQVDENNKVFIGHSDSASANGAAVGY